MTGHGGADDAEVRRLREEIANDLVALRRTFGRRGPSPASVPGGDIPEQVSGILRGNPAWAAAAAAGALAGLWVAVRNRFRKSRPQ